MSSVGARAVQVVAALAAARAHGHRVLDDADEDLLDGLLLARVAQQDRHVGVEVEGLAYGVGRVTGRSVEAVDAHDERYGAPLEVVDGGEAVLQAAGVGEDDGTQSAGRQLVPQEPETVLPGVPKR